ncbi:MAG: pilus assembly PilX N-terminal domain-containing protein [Candidatus Omnitrophica bacterium]|nr:pilus assembly PilX N-terminal domain-containing protein [Candidatus Omnitrophota bacterium]
MKITIKNNKGFALLLTLIVMMILFIFGAAYLTSMISETGIARNQEKSELAFFIAESGLERAIRLLVEDNTWRTAALTENMTDGFYELEVVDDPVDPEKIRITSTGYAGPASRTTRITLIITSGFSYALFSADTTDPVVADIDCSTASGSVSGDVHANGTALMGGVSISGELTQGELGDPILSMIEIDMSFHRANATVIYPGGTVINAQRIQNQLIYVEGDVTIDCSGNKGVTFVQTSLIAEGDINIIGGNTLKIDEYNYPGQGKVVSLATKTGNITSTDASKIQERDIKGLLFSEQGTIDFDYLKIDAAVYANNMVFRYALDVDYKVKRFPTIGFVFGTQFFKWEEVF